MKLALYDIKGKAKKNLELDTNIENFKVNEKAIRETVLMNLANSRKSVACAKKKSEVNYSGAKLWRQKGTGRARIHYRAATHLRGGAVIFGPRVRDFSFSVPKKVKKVALKSALVKALKSNDVIVVDKLEINEPKTKVLVEMLKNLGITKKALVIGKEENQNFKLAIRNLKGYAFRTAAKIGVFDIVSHEKILIEQDAFEEIKKRY